MNENGQTDNEQANAGSSADDQWSAAFEETKKATEPKKEEVEARPASFTNLRHESAGSISNMDMLLDIPLTVSVEMGRSRMLVKDLLHLPPPSGRGGGGGGEVAGNPPPPAGTGWGGGAGDPRGGADGDTRKRQA